MAIALSPIHGDLSASPIAISSFLAANQCAFVRCPPTKKSGWQTAPVGSKVLIEATIAGWDADLDHILLGHSDPVDQPKGTYAAEVVKR